MLHRSILRPLLFRLPPETAHELTVHALTAAMRLRPLRRFVESRFHTSHFGTLERFGLQFANPIGLAAGFDKTGESSHALAALGFGFIEAGTATFHPQPGNPRPRLFRLVADDALINRLGFNNPGADVLAANLTRDKPACVLGVNIGKSRIVPNEVATLDYLAAFDAVFDCADYIAVNVSSPNTPGLRELQSEKSLRELLDALQTRNAELARARHTRARPLLVKVAPDLDRAALEGIVAVAQDVNMAGIIATNTTIARPALRTPREHVESLGAGGLSGRPLRLRSTEVIRELYRLTRGAIPILGGGGVFSSDDAWEKIAAGASLVQIWTGFIYEGAGVVRRINDGLAARLEREGFKTFDEAVGCRADER